MLDNIVNEEQNKLYAFRMDNFREKNYKIGNANNGKCETNSNIIITKEENTNSFTGNTDIKKNQNNNMEINSIVIINIKTINNNENINSNSKKNKENNGIDEVIENSFKDTVDKMLKIGRGIFQSKRA